ncbi:MAG: DUF1772 domain-containing protein [Anaerolineae bacterium]|nr:DUF1772 domain-containing protein [Anaerolineae bacterium]
MLFAQFALIVSIIACGLFAGLMLTLVVLLERMWRALPVTGYIQAMQSFLPVAKGNPIITVITLLPIVAPIPALLALNAASARTPFILASIGLLLACGPLLVTLRFNFPIYDTMMGWQTDPLPQDWQQMGNRFFRMNLIRLSLALAAMVCFLLALSGAN